MKEFQKEITILKRTINNYTHHCIIDDTIVSIQAWRRSKHKFQLYLILHLFTLGIIHLISLFIPSLYLKMYCKRSSGLMADFFLITDKNKKEHLVTLEKISLEHKNNSLSTFYKSHFGNDTLLRVFRYHFMTYIYREIDNSVHGLYLDLTKYKNNEIHLFMTECMNTENYKEHRKAFGKNIFEISELSLLRYFFIVEIPANIIVFISSIVHFAYGNYILGGYYMMFILVIFLVKVLYKKMMFKRIPIDRFSNDFTTLSLMVSSLKNIEKKVINNKDIIPGDFIVLKKGQIVPCDCLLLEGDCVVNEHVLTGRTSVARKTYLPKDDKDFSYPKSKNSFLYQRSTLVKCHSSVADNKSIIVIAVNIGGNTLRSNLYASTQINNEIDITRLYNHKITLIICNCFVFIFCVIAMVFSFYNNKLLFGKVNLLIEYIIKCAVIAIFPLYHISLFFINFFCMIKLKKNKVECVDESKLEIAGKISTIFFDKTGTLSEDVLQISGYQPVNYEGSEPVLGALDEKEPKRLKLNHLNYWKEYKRTSVSFKCVNKGELHAIYYLHCLVTCHILEKINNENCGPLLEKNMMKRLKWEINGIKINIEDDVNPENSISVDTIEVYPKNYYKITEKAKFDRINGINKIFKLQIYCRFMSNSSQGISSIVKNIYDDSLRFFCKGQPEDILPQCLANTLPKDIETVLVNHRKNGYRIIACATKEVETLSFDNKEEFYMQNLTFLGFILLKNNLKRETKKVVDKLKKMDLELIMATGDSLYTSLSVAYESKFISDKNIYVFELDKDKDKENEENRQILITHLYQKEEEKNKSPEDSLSVSGRRLLNDSSSINDSNSKVVFHKINQFNFDPNYLEILDLMKHNSLYCVSGETFTYVFNQYKKETLIGKQTNNLLPYTRLMRYMKHLCKIYYFMSAYNKAELITYYKTIPDKVIAMVGDGVNDLSAMMASHVGISLKRRRICHFYSMDNSLECVEKIIKVGRATRENYISFLLFFILAGAIQGIMNMAVFSINSEFDSSHNVTIEMIILVSSCLAFQINPDYSINGHPLYQSSFYTQYSIVKVVGHLSIKIIEAGAFFFLYSYNPLLEDQLRSKDCLGAYLFLLGCGHIISSIIGFNIDAFSRVNNLGNDFVTFYLTIMEFYILSLLTLTSWNFHSNIFNLLTFEFLKTNLDAYDDRYKLILFGLLVLDFGITIFYAKILTFIYTYLAKRELKKLQKNQKIIKANPRESKLNIKLQ